MKLFGIILYVIAYAAFFRWSINDQQHTFDLENPKWYQDKSMPRCYSVWISCLFMLFLLSPVGFVLGYVMIEAIEIIK